MCPWKRWHFYEFVFTFEKKYRNKRKKTIWDPAYGKSNTSSVPWKVDLSVEVGKTRSIKWTGELKFIILYYLF